MFWAMILINNYQGPNNNALYNENFAYRDDLEFARICTLKDVCLPLSTALKKNEVNHSEYMYHNLNRFHVIVEPGMSLLKRCMGLVRNTYKKAGSRLNPEHNRILCHPNY